MKTPTVSSIRSTLVEMVESQNREGFDRATMWSRRVTVCLRTLGMYSVAHIQGWFIGLGMAPKLGLWWGLDTEVPNDPQGDLVALYLYGPLGSPEPPDHSVLLLTDLGSWMTTELEMREQRRKAEGKVTVANLTLQQRLYPHYSFTSPE